jgi:ABC-type sugar transport system permease subunit
METGRRYLIAAGFLLPFAVGLVLFQYWPIVSMVRNSFHQYSFLSTAAPKNVGFANYEALVQDPQFHKAITITLLFAVGVVVLVVPIGLALALFLNQGFRGTRFLRLVTFMPVVTSVVVVATLWRLLLDPANGLLNTALTSVGIGGQPFLTSAHQALPSIIAITAWQQVGFSMILFLAGLQGIPAEIQEAAELDGATSFQRLRYVTLPALKRTMIFVVVVMTIFSFQAFAPDFVLTQGGPENSTLLLVYYLYRTAFGFFQPGYASAMAVVLFLMIVAIGASQALVQRAARRVR